MVMSMQERSERLYGKEITAGDYSYFYGTQNFLLTVCFGGGLFQFLQLLPGRQSPLEMVCAFIYLVYNIAGMLIVRVSTVGFKFEDRKCLWITMRMALAMAVYGIIIFVTLPTFQNTVALQLMGIFGVINVIVILPCNIFESLHVLHARSNGIGTENARPLECCALWFLNVFFFVAYFFLIGTIVICLALLANGGSQVLWALLTTFYVGINIVPIVVPKVQHLVLTEVRTWPLKCVIIQYAVVILAVILIGAVLGAVKTSRRLKIVFGALGVSNGVIVALALTIVAFRALADPRTKQGSPLTKGAEESKRIDDAL